jgi:hypothetical protein
VLDFVGGVRGQRRADPWPDLARAFGIVAAKNREEFDYIYLEPAVEAAFQALHPTSSLLMGGTAD